MISRSSGRIANHHWLVMGESDLLQEFGDNVYIWFFFRFRYWTCYIFTFITRRSAFIQIHEKTKAVPKLGEGLQNRGAILETWWILFVMIRALMRNCIRTSLNVVERVAPCAEKEQYLWTASVTEWIEQLAYWWGGCSLSHVQTQCIGELEWLLPGWV